MSGNAEINVRRESWDRSIFASVVGGEYGALDLPGTTVVDIGAHIGSFSILAALKGARRVLAFEAWAENYELLVMNCRSLPAVECHHAAVWRSDLDDAVLTWSQAANPQNTGGGTVIECASIGGEPISGEMRCAVRAIPFDDIVDRVGTIDVLKIDAEGSEFPILLTSRKLDRVGTIVGECHTVGGLAERMGIPGVPEWSIGRLREHLERQGFDVTTRDKGPLGTFRAVRRHTLR